MTLDEIFKICEKVRIIAASKYVDHLKIYNLFKKGIVEFGENQVQALALKKEELQNLDIKWHFIGNLQSNKINLLLKQNPILWQSCNSLKIAKAVNKRLTYKLNTLLEINTANESTKSGINLNKAIEEYFQIQEECKNINLCGVMCIGAHSDNYKDIKNSFENTFKIFEKLQNNGAKICSMGMSNDFELAIKCGSNMVRLGSVLFKNNTL